MSETEAVAGVDPAEARAAGRRRWPIAAGALLLLLGLIYVWLVASADLDDGHVSVRPRANVELTRVAMPVSSDDSFVFVPFSGADTRVHVFRSVRNTSPVPVTLEELFPGGLGAFCGLILDGAARASLLEPRGGLSREDIDGTAPLPLTLPPDREALIMIPLRPGCPDGGPTPAMQGYSSHHRVPLEFSILGWPRTIDLELDDAVVWSEAPLPIESMIETIAPTLP